jgi:hypothetical protein
MKSAPFHSSLVVALGFLLIGLVSARSAVIVNYQDGTSSLSSVPGLELTLPTITDPGQASWQLSSFTWLSSSGSGHTATGRLTLWIFDAALYDPAGKTPNGFSSQDTGFVAQSLTYSAGSYSFSSPLILEGGKTYLFLNAGVVSTGQGAPANYGASTSASIPGVQRWVASNGATAWTETTGAPNFSLTLQAVPVPEPTVTMLGLIGVALLVSRRARPVSKSS